MCTPLAISKWSKGGEVCSRNRDQQDVDMGSRTLEYGFFPRFGASESEYTLAPKQIPALRNIG